MTNLLVEGGGRTLGAFHDAGLADEYHVYIASLLIGGREATGALDARGPTRVKECPRLGSNRTLRRLGSGWLVESRAGVASASSDGCGTAL